MAMKDFTLRTTVAAPYDTTLDRVCDLLTDAGFGVLTEIDLQATLDAKLGVEIPPQMILGACRPQLAHAALDADPRFATMLPCNVVVAAEGDHHTRVEVFDPDVIAAISDASDLYEVAAEARHRLSTMLTTLTRELEATDAARA
jgi:uncharacterized protein (DUF302 family)